MINSFSQACSKPKDMKTPKRSENRARDFGAFHVRVSEEEHALIKLNAHNTGQSPAELMRQLAQGYEPVSLLDAQHIVELIHLRGDLGRLGGLFKAWLFGEPRKPGLPITQVRAALNDIDAIKKQIKKVLVLLDQDIQA